MLDQLTKSIELARVRELVDLVKHRDDFFSKFDADCDPEKRRWYQIYEQALIALDEESWQILKQKAVAHYPERSGIRRPKEAFFSQLNEAFAYKYLCDLGHEGVRLMREAQDRKTPDIQYRKGGEIFFCEVKTLGISDDELGRRCESREKLLKGEELPVRSLSIYASLSDGFLQSKFSSTVGAARTQIKSGSDLAQGLVFMILEFDDLALDHLDTYRKQLVDACHRFQLGRLEFYQIHRMVALVHVD